MHVADGRSDLGIVIALQRFLDEIDETGLALQSRQERDRLAADRLRRLFGNRRLESAFSATFACGFVSAALSPSNFRFSSTSATCRATGPWNKTRKKIRMASQIRPISVKPFFEVFRLPRFSNRMQYIVPRRGEKGQGRDGLAWYRTPTGKLPIVSNGK